MEALFNLPSGDQVRVIDTATAGRNLGRALQLFREGATEPLFFGDEPRPQGVVISFDQWAEYEAMKKEVEFERRMEQTARERISSTAPEDYVSFEDAAREGGWDLDVEDDTDGRQ
jgi:hypothetical protein